MVKALIGLVAAIVIAAGGYFGFQFYTQHRVTNEIEAAFERIRAAGGKASHGQVSFELSSRTAVIKDIAVETASQPPVAIKIANFTVTRAGQPDAAHFSSDSVEASDIEIATGIAGPPNMQAIYKAPRLTIKDLTAPIGVQRPPASSSIIDIYRFGLEQFAAVTASSMTIPTLSLTMNMGGAAPMAGDFTYSNLSIQDIKDGKIATVKSDGAAFTLDVQQAGTAQKFTGKIENAATYDFDSSALAAVLDPQKANDDRYYRLYRQASIGAYTITFGPGVNARIDGMTMDDVGVRPSRLQLPALLAMIPAAGTVPSPAQANALIEKAAGLYEGMRIGNAEMRGLSVETPQGPFKLAAIRLNLENGKVGEFAIEGVDTRTPKGPLKVGRFALKSLDIANMLRMTALYANAAQRPSPDQALGMLRLLEGAEVKNLVAPYKSTSRQVNIDTIALNWGQFVGPIPSQVHLNAKLTTPIDATDAAPLVAAGLNTLTLDSELGAAWTEASGAFALTPVNIELGGVVKMQARLSLANVPRGIFTLIPQQAAVSAAQVEAGTLELTVHDLGGVDLGVAQYARTHNVSPDAARQAIIGNIKAPDDPAVAPTPEVVALTDAMTRFIATSRQTLTIKLTPNGRMPVLKIVQLLQQADPSVALAQFKIEASTGP